MLAAALLSLALSPCSLQGETWIPARPLEVEGLGASRAVAVAGPWSAFVRVLPMPEELRRYHAPRPPWELVRVGPGGVAEVVASRPASRGGGRYEPTVVAVAEDGAVTATWRHGNYVLVAPPGSPAIEHAVHDDGALDGVALSTERLVLVHGETRALTVRTFDVSGVADPVALGVYTPRSEDEVAFGAPWLAWLAEGGEVHAVHLESGERKAIEFAPPHDVHVDGVWGGALFAHASSAPESSRAYVVDFVAGEAHALAVPWRPLVCTPDGVLGAGWFWDPVDDTLRRVEPTLDDSATALRAAPGMLWLQDVRRERCWTIDLGAEPVAVPAGRVVAPLPALAPRESEAARDAARAAWRRSRR